MEGLGGISTSEALCEGRFFVRTRHAQGGKARRRSGCGRCHANFGKIGPKPPLPGRRLGGCAKFDAICAGEGSFPQPQPGTANTTRASLTRRLSNLPDALKSVKKRHGVSRLLPNAGTFASGVRSRERSGVCQFLLENFGSGGTSRAISDSLNSQVRVLGRRTDCIPGLVPTLHAIFGCGCHGKSRHASFPCHGIPIL